jgi:hypothetical protein
MGQAQAISGVLDRRARPVPVPVGGDELAPARGSSSDWLGLLVLDGFPAPHVRDRILCVLSRPTSRWGLPPCSGVVVPVPVTQKQIGHGPDLDRGVCSLSGVVNG